MDTEQPTRSRRWARTAGEWIVTIVLLVVASSVLGWLRAPDLPDDAPPLVVSTLDGGTLDLADLRGKPVVINFWATWCGPCRAEMPLLRAWAADRDDVAFLAVSTDRDPRAVRRYAEGWDLPLPIVLADPGTQAAWGVSTLPTTVIVDAAGRVVGAHTGLITPPQLELMLP